MKSRPGAPNMSGNPATAGSTAQEAVVSRKPWRRLSAAGRLAAQASATAAPTSIASTAASAKARALPSRLARSTKKGTSISPPSPSTSQPRM